MLLHIKYIIQGWFNYFLDIISDLRYKKYFDDRLIICNSCEDCKRGICQYCGCVVKAKTKSEDSKCPIGKWDTINNTIKK